jgi:hypothetical protein
MGKILTEKTQKKLIRMHKDLGKEIRWRSRFSLGRTLELLSEMHELVVRWNSWEKKR